jgi:hypothetical protein
MCDGKLASDSDSARLRALKQIVSQSKISKLLGAQGQTRFCKRITNLQLIWLIVGMGLFAGKSYRSIFRLFVASEILVPCRATLTMARKRLTAKFFELLYQTIVHLLAKSPEKHSHSFYKNLRLMGIDGTLLDVSDSRDNRKKFGRPSNQSCPGAFPKARVLSLCELGTRVLWRSVIGGYSTSEQKLALSLLKFLDRRMLLLADRNFGVAPIIYPLLARGVSFLIRVKKSQCFPVEKALSDGSFLSTIYIDKNDRRAGRKGKTVRVIRYTHRDPNRTGYQEVHVLVTSLLDAEKYPASEMANLYHVRWEEEIAFSECKVSLGNNEVLRSQSPEMVRQEIWGLLISHFIIRKLIFQAAERAGVPSTRISFTSAMDILHTRLPEAPRSQRKIRKWLQALIIEISLEQLPPRSNRINPRKVKKRSKHWPTKKDRDRSPPKPTGSFKEFIEILI